MPTRHFNAFPPPQQTYAKIIKSLLPIIGKKQQIKNNKDMALPDATYQINALQVQQANLKDYQRICGFANTGQIPPTYFAVLSQKLQATMMVDEPFPFAILGLVHIANSVTQYRPIADSETVVMQVSLGNLQAHDKGKQFDFITKVYAAHQPDELIWEGTSTYLSRQKPTAQDGDKQDSPAKNIKTIAEKPAAGQNDVHHVFAVPEDIGRRYALISGDFNLIHLHPYTAKAFGFPKAIAHGMWSKAKCLSLLDLPEAYQVAVAFKLPIFLPSEVELIGDTMHQLDETGTAKFELYHAANHKPHLAGTVTRV